MREYDFNVRGAASLDVEGVVSLGETFYDCYSHSRWVVLGFVGLIRGWV